MIGIAMNGLIQARIFLRRHRRIRLASEGSSPLQEARRLSRAGYSVAAVVTARVVVEQALRDTAIAQARWNEGGRKWVPGLRQYNALLRERGVISRSTSRSIDKFSKAANRVAHGTPIDRFRAVAIVRRGAKIVATLKGGAA